MIIITIFLRLFVAFIAILSAYLFYFNVVDPYILDPMCMTNTTKCVQQIKCNGTPKQIKIH